MALRSFALGLLLLSCSCSLLSGAFAQPAPPAPPACNVNADCKTGNLTTCCLIPDGPGVCIDGAKQECLASGEACDKTSVCTAGSFVKSCCPAGTSCINGFCGLTCGKGDCRTFCSAQVAFCTGGQCIGDSALCQLQDAVLGKLDTNYYPCARGYNCTDITQEKKVGCCPAAQACGDPLQPETVTCCAAGQTCKAGKCAAGVVAAIACTNGDVKIGGTCCKKDKVCGVGAAQSCCASDRVCSLGQCVLPATAKPVGDTVSQVCGNQTIYCAQGSICLNGACVLKSATCGDKCCPSGTVCVLTTGGPVCCKSENACGRIGLSRAGVRETQSCCSTGSTCLPSGLCSAGKVLGTTNASAPAPAPTANVTADLINRASGRGGPTASPAVQTRAPTASPRPSPNASPSPSPSPEPTPSPVPEGTAVNGGGMFAGLMNALMGAMGR